MVSALFGAASNIPSKLNSSVDMSSYKEIKKQDNKIYFDSNGSDTNGIYNYVYSPRTGDDNKKNIFLEGSFEKIDRFDPLYFNGEVLTDDANKTFQKFIEKIHHYIQDESREIVVSVIGYTQKVENNVTDINLESSYTNFFQKMLQRDDLDKKDAVKEALDYLHIVYKKMLDNNISDDIIYREKRVGKDQLYTEEFTDGRDKNNRVEVAIYVKEVVDPDTDLDGVHDSKDYCPNTPLGANVDKNGCPLIMALDLKFDFDKATISEKKSLDDIEKLSNFMKKYPAYHANIVGHTDSKGSVKYNQKLSERRAKAVRDIMIKHGVEASRLSFEGKGESEPLFENINPLNRHKNRRTEVELTLPVQKKKSIMIKPRTRSSRE
jgi:hypothetical protein